MNRPVPSRQPRPEVAASAAEVDALQFKPANAQLLNRLDQPGRPVRLTSLGSTQLRLEGIDALELHFDSTHQSRPMADQARDFLTGKLGLNPVPYRPPRNIQVKPPVKPPVLKDATEGFILSRPSGRLHRRDLPGGLVHQYPRAA
jgi:hypothetical protein